MLLVILTTPVEILWSADAAFPYATAITIRDLHVKFCNGTSVSTASCVSPTTSLAGNYAQAELLAYKKMGSNIIETSPGLLTNCVAESGAIDSINGMIPGNASAGSPQLFAAVFRMYSTVGSPGGSANTYTSPMALLLAPRIFHLLL